MLDEVQCECDEQTKISRPIEKQMNEISPLEDNQPSRVKGRERDVTIGLKLVMMGFDLFEGMKFSSRWLFQLEKDFPLFFSEEFFQIFAFQSI